MNIDLHTHAKLSKKSAFSLAFYLQSVAEARENGLTALALTEHFNTAGFCELYEELDRTFAYRNDYYDLEGFKVFPGMEVDVREGGHVLVIGPKDAVLDLRDRLKEHETEDCFIELDALLDLCGEQRFLTVGAHPLRESNPLFQHPASTLRRLDALDLNAKDLYAYGPGMEEKVHRLAREVGIPVVTGSDAHHTLQFGCVANRLAKDCESVAELKACIREGCYRIQLSPCLQVKVKAASMMKEVLKQQWKEPELPELPGQEERESGWTA